jgi:hypothetical protein
MNGSLVATSAQLLLQRPDVAGVGTVEARVRRIYQILFARGPSSVEALLADAFLGSEPSGARWQQFAQALLLTNEFVFVD